MIVPIFTVSHLTYFTDDYVFAPAYIPYVCSVEFLRISVHVNGTRGFSVQCAIKGKWTIR